MGLGVESCMIWCSYFRRRKRGRWERSGSFKGSLEGTEEENGEKVCRERYAKLKDLSFYFSASSASKDI